MIVSIPGKRKHLAAIFVTTSDRHLHRQRVQRFWLTEKWISGREYLQFIGIGCENAWGKYLRFNIRNAATAWHFNRKKNMNEFDWWFHWNSSGDQMPGNHFPKWYCWFEIRTSQFWPSLIDRAAATLVLHRRIDISERKDDVNLIEIYYYVVMRYHYSLFGLIYIEFFKLMAFLFLDWQQFVTNKLWSWEQMNLQWAKNFTGSVKIVYYDDLVDNVESTLRSILKFISFPTNEVNWFFFSSFHSKLN